jgi:hypothetical protein
MNLFLDNGDNLLASMLLKMSSFPRKRRNSGVSVAARFREERWLAHGEDPPQGGHLVKPRCSLLVAS